MTKKQLKHNANAPLYVHFLFVVLEKNKKIKRETHLRDSLPSVSISGTLLCRPVFAYRRTLLDDVQPMFHHGT